MKGGSGGDASGGSGANLALRTEDLTVWVMERAEKFPRNHKYTVGDKLVETCLEMTTLVVEANYLPSQSRAKLVRLQAAARAVTQAGVLIRVAQRLGLLSARQRGHFAQQSEALGRMLGRRIAS